MRTSAGRAAEQKEVSGSTADDDVRIARQPVESAATSYDLVVIGGGIYGVALIFEVSRRGYRAVLLERGDFGGGTSWSSLRIIHGGLRYLQSLDLRRFRESVAKRRWFCVNFRPGAAPAVPDAAPWPGLEASRFPAPGARRQRSARSSPPSGSRAPGPPAARPGPERS